MIPIGAKMRDYGRDGGGKFNSFTKAYKDNPSIEHYVKLRRENPNAEIEVAVIGGFEQAGFMQPELQKYGLDLDLVRSAMFGDPSSMAELSLRLLERMIEAKSLSKSGKTHLTRRGLGIPDSLINWLIASMLDGASRDDYLHIPRELIVLIRERLGGSNPGYEQAHRIDELRTRAMFIGAKLKARGIEPSFRVMGKIMGVAPSTVKRWFPQGNFAEITSLFSSTYDENGNIRTR